MFDCFVYSNFRPTPMKVLSELQANTCKDPAVTSGQNWFDCSDFSNFRPTLLKILLAFRTSDQSLKSLRTSYKNLVDNSKDFRPILVKILQ